MSNKMLIDATHPEETRVVVLRGNRVEEFDFEAADRLQLRGNIYLAKVTRVEPSLQAAFVDYGGNRHGFLAFSEIHPDYYQIPHADRQALLREHAREDAEQAEREDSQAERGAARSGSTDDGTAEAQSETEESADEADAEAEDAEGSSPTTEAAAADVASSESVTEPDGSDEEPAEAAQAEPEENGDSSSEEDDKVESVGAEDALEEVPERRKPRPRQYKIQEVIKRRQVMLVQVVKEERGSKGAALTTFLSLAGRYSVLMPNTARGGGISRKITQPTDRKRLKAIASELEVPEGMGVILRTAGANRTKSEVKRDFEYLLRLWENVRELTLKSSAPKLVYEEGSLIKRSIRDLYSREIDQVVVAGDDAYREAKDFMRMLMPSHARNVQLYKETTPIFARSNVEAQLDAMFSPQVTLKSGGYVVINQTEALVSIDVNSGRSTREHSIEDTALKTNLEAADEVARQLRLRDLAGLIVIDFIDMDEKRNNRAVERKLKDCLRADRARIQVGRVSHFGLMEMSRQRIRTGVLESSTVPCPHCRGTGQVRSVSSLSLQILRALEEQLLKSSTHNLQVRTRPEVALYVLNQKRRHLAELEARFGVSIAISEDTPENGAGFLVERGSTVEDRAERSGAIAMADVHEDDEAVDAAAADDDAQDAGGDDGRKRRRRRRRGNGDDRPRRRADAGAASDEADGEGDAVETDADATAEAQDDESGGRKRRRGRRGGKRRGRGRDSADAKRDEASGEDAQTEEGSVAAEASGAESQSAGKEQEIEAVAEEDSDHAPEVSADETPAEETPAEETPAEAIADEAPVEARAGNGGDTEPHAEEAETVETAAEEAPAELQPDEVPAETRSDDDQHDDRSGETSRPRAEDNNRPKRSGWWNRRSSFF